MGSAIEPAAVAARSTLATRWELAGLLDVVQGLQRRAAAEHQRSRQDGEFGRAGRR